jgi:phosphoribosylformylglycinamidine synthase
LLPALIAERIVAGAHDLSVGGLGVALGRMAIASRCGASIDLPDPAARWPSATLYGEAAGRALVSLAPPDTERLATAAAAAGVPVLRLGRATGQDLAIDIGPLPHLQIPLEHLRQAWETPF